MRLVLHIIFKWKELQDSISYSSELLHIILVCFILFSAFSRNTLKRNNFSKTVPFLLVVPACFNALISQFSDSRDPWLTPTPFMPSLLWLFILISKEPTRELSRVEQNRARIGRASHWDRRYLWRLTCQLGLSAIMPLRYLVEIQRSPRIIGLVSVFFKVFRVL